MLGIDEGKPTFAGERNVVRPALIDQEYLEDVSGEHRMHRNEHQAAQRRLEKLPSCRYPLY